MVLICISLMIVILSSLNAWRLVGRLYIFCGEMCIQFLFQFFKKWFFIYFLFGCAFQLPVGSQVPGIELLPLQWKGGALTSAREAPLSNFLMELFVFLLLSVEVSFLFWILSPCLIHSLHIFSPIQQVAFWLLTVSFAVQVFSLT